METKYGFAFGQLNGMIVKLFYLSFYLLNGKICVFLSGGINDSIVLADERAE